MSKSKNRPDRSTGLSNQVNQLRLYQKHGVQFLLSKRSVLLADEMGLGKTVQTIVAISKGREKYNRVLIVCPASLCLNWYREFELWAPGLTVRRVIGHSNDRIATYRLPVRVLIASYEQIRSDSEKIQSEVEFDLVVLDEAQRIKNVHSSTNWACRLIRRHQSWALSGTPLENSPEDLRGIFRFLDPKLLYSGMSPTEVHNAIDGFFLRRTKKQVLKELPPILYRDLRLELGKLQRRAYEGVWNTRFQIVKDNGKKLNIANMFSVLTRLKQICNFDRDTGQSVKLDVLHELLETIKSTDQKVLVFSQFVETLFWLTDRLQIQHDVFHGGLSQEVRDRLVHSFKQNTGPCALLISLKAGGVGLNLQEASTVILFDRWWNPAVESQAIQRAHRYGKSTSLEVISFIVEDSVEERIAEILESKAELFDRYINDAPSEEEVKALSKDDLRQILKI